MKTEPAIENTEGAKRLSILSLRSLCSLWPILFLSAGIIIGDLCAAHAERAWAAALIRASLAAGGESGGQQLRHAAIGSITNILIAPDHVAIHGRDGSFQWFP